MSEFMERHPYLRVLLQLDDGYRDIVSEGLDVAIRIGELKESTLVARRITNVRRYLCASPNYLARKGVPATPSDLTNHACLHYNNILLCEEWALTGPDGPETVAVSGPLSDHKQTFAAGLPNDRSIRITNVNEKQIIDLINKYTHISPFFLAI